MGGDVGGSRHVSGRHWDWRDRDRYRPVPQEQECECASRWG